SADLRPRERPAPRPALPRPASPSRRDPHRASHPLLTRSSPPGALMSSLAPGPGLRPRLAPVGGAVPALALGLSLTPARAPPAPTAVVTPGDLRINEIYGGGGNSGATVQNDFVELVNTSAADIDIDGWSLQYASRTGTFNNTLTLSGTVPA